MTAQALSPQPPAQVHATAKYARVPLDAAVVATMTTGMVTTAATTATKASPMLLVLLVSLVLLVLPTTAPHLAPQRKVTSKDSFQKRTVQSQKMKVMPEAAAIRRHRHHPAAPKPSELAHTSR